MNENIGVSLNMFIQTKIRLANWYCINQAQWKNFSVLCFLKPTEARTAIFLFYVQKILALPSLDVLTYNHSEFKIEATVRDVLLTLEVRS